MQSGKLSRWLGLGLVLNISIMVWRFLAISNSLIAFPYQTVTDWISDPEPCIWLIFYGLGFVGVRMAVTGDRRPLLFWNVVYLVLLVPYGHWSPMSLETLLRYPNNVLIFGAGIATIAIYIGERRKRIEHRTGEATLSS